jgi:acetyl-CoA synthetase
MTAPAAPRIVAKEGPAAARHVLRECTGAAVLTERASKKLLAAYGVDVTREDIATTPEAAVALAARIGYPVVLKAESAAIPHKTEAGVVHLNLRSGEEVTAAFDDIRAKVSRLPNSVAFEGVLVQEMVKVDLELIVGAHRDPQFGPLVVVGVGGIFVELLRDTVSALAPVSKAQATDMLESLKGARVLHGFAAAGQ